jgi:hypothetical protein
MERYFFGQDQNGQWYMLPVALKEIWVRLVSKQDYSEYDAWREIEEYRLTEEIHDITFENPL